MESINDNGQIASHVIEEALKTNRQQRVRAVAQAIQAALEEHGCQLISRPVITPEGRIEGQIQIVAAGE